MEGGTDQGHLKRFAAAYGSPEWGRAMMQVMILALLLAWTGAPARAGQEMSDGASSTAVRVFVRTDDSGEATELAARKQSVKDLASAVASKKKSLVLVDAEEKGDVVLAVEDRAVTVPKVVFGMGERPGQPPGGGGVVRVAVLHVTLKWDDGSIAFSNKNKPFESARGWKSAADDIAGQVNQWVSAHRADILRGRQSGARLP